jgi:hypothetical protein
MRQGLPSRRVGESGRLSVFSEEVREGCARARDREAAAGLLNLGQRQWFSTM